MDKLLIHWSQVHNYINSQYLEVLMVAMVPDYNPQQLLITWKKYLFKKVDQNWKGFPRHFVSLGARVLNFKGVYLAHIFVFLSDYKNMLLFKLLSINHFKSFKKILYGGYLMMKKDYKSSRWTINFHYMISKDHNLVNFYVLEPILFPHWF